MVADIVDGVAALSGREVLEKLVVVVRLRLLGNDNFGVVRRELKDDVLDFLAELERLERLEALWRDLDARRLRNLIDSARSASQLIPVPVTLFPALFAPKPTPQRATSHVRLPYPTSTLTIL